MLIAEQEAFVDIVGDDSRLVGGWLNVVAGSQCCLMLVSQFRLIYLAHASAMPELSGATDG